MFRTKRLMLQSFSDKDYTNMKEMLSNEEIGKTNMIPSLKSEADFLKIFNSFKNLSLNNDCFVVGVYLNNSLIGFMNQTEVDGESIELGYVINPKYKNNGYATEALIKAIEILFERGFKEVICGSFEENKASIRVMIKAGMNKIDKEDDIEYKGIIHHCVYYSLKNK